MEHEENFYANIAYSNYKPRVKRSINWEGIGFTILTFTTLFIATFLIMLAV